MRVSLLRHFAIAVFILSIISNIVVWNYARTTQARWINVPPVPEKEYASSSGFGDTQLSFRIVGLMLQNLGDTGGLSRSLAEYDYDLLSGWFNLADYLDPHSSYIPYLAAYYFGAVQTPESLPPLVAYLEKVGSRVENKENWRWLVQAIYLARYRMEDLDLSLRLSKKLSSLDGKNGIVLPVWAKNMDVMIMNVAGDKQAAYQIMLQTLETEGQNMEPTEYLFLLDYICYQILEPDEARLNPACSEIWDERNVLKQD